MNKEMFRKEIEINGGQQTVDHIDNVAQLMGKMADMLGEDRDAYVTAGELHDAGKLNVSPAILNSNHRLSDREYAEIQTHPTSGQNIVKLINGLSDLERRFASDAAAYHHAWFNGSRKGIDSNNGGYYPGMADKTVSRDAIPTVARVCAICDVYDAITANRSYDGAKSPEYALNIMDNLLMEGQFDPALYKVFVTKVLGREYMASQKAAV